MNSGGTRPPGALGPGLGAQGPPPHSAVPSTPDAGGTPALPGRTPGGQPPPRTLIFVYGTLKRGGSNHAYLRGQRFIAEARTRPGFTLYGLEGYPGLVPEDEDTEGVAGEIWSVDSATLAALDDLEGISEGLYRRELIPLQPPHDAQPVATYVYARSVAGRPRLGPHWPT